VEEEMNKLFLIAIMMLIAVPAVAQQTVCYSWEDGGLLMGYYGNIVDIVNVSGPQTGSQGSTLPDYTCPGAYDGEYYLHVAEDPHYSTPQAYIAWVTNLLDGDLVTVSFYGYDITPGASPSWRIWGHWTDSVDPESYLGSASGPADYSAGLGWDMMEHTWTMAGGDGNALMVEGRLYSTPATMDPDHTDYWCDYVCVTAPDHAVVIFQLASPVEDASWANIKALYR